MFKQILTKQFTVIQYKVPSLPKNRPKQINPKKLNNGKKIVINIFIIYNI